MNFFLCSVNENGSLLDKKDTPEDDESSDIDEDEKKDLEDELHQDKDTEEVNEENMEINSAAEESSVLDTFVSLVVLGCFILQTSRL